MILGITGRTGCGKTTLLELLRQRDALVLDCDAIYHRLLRTSPELTAAIQMYFPQAVQDGILNRKRLGAIVFQNPSALSQLNAITHGAIRNEVQRLLESRPALAAIDAIALFESGLAELCDITVAITAPEDQQVQRLVERDGITREYARSRIAAQHSEAWFRERCDYCLDNCGSLADFQEKCLVFLEKLSMESFD